jgi:hypothetical protein
VVLGLVGIEDNYASQLRSAADRLAVKTTEEERLGKEIVRYQEGYKDNKLTLIEQIIDARLDWPELIRKLNEVTKSIYERNDLLQYVQYNNYSYNVERAQLTVSATLSDPSGKNLTRLAELEEAFRTYPRDPNNPEDETQPYFYGLQDFRSFSKNFEKSTGRYKSSFSLSLFTEPQTK